MPSFQHSSNWWSWILFVLSSICQDFGSTRFYPNRNPRKFRLPLERRLEGFYWTLSAGEKTFLHPEWHHFKFQAFIYRMCFCMCFWPIKLVLSKQEPKEKPAASGKKAWGLWNFESWRVLVLVSRCNFQVLKVFASIFIFAWRFALVLFFLQISSIWDSFRSQGFCPCRRRKIRLPPNRRLERKTFRAVFLNKLLLAEWLKNEIFAPVHSKETPAGATPAPAESAAPQKAWGLLAGVSKL